jgi:hypothetical protein
MDLTVAPDYNDSSSKAADRVAATAAAKPDCKRVLPTGQPPNNHSSYCRCLVKPFLAPLCITGRHVERFATSSPELEAACRNFEGEVRTADGDCVAVLALCANGHLGFNEPRMNPHSPTLDVVLRREIIEANVRYWGDCDQEARRSDGIGSVNHPTQRYAVLRCRFGHGSLLKNLCYVCLWGRIGR